MRGSINVIAAAGGAMGATAGAGTDFQDRHGAAPIPVFLGSQSVTVAGGASPTNAVVTTVAVAPGVGTSTALFDDEFSSAPWQAHRTWQAGDFWAYTATFDTGGNGIQEGPTWWANPIATPAAATVYPAPSGGVLSLGLMTSPAGITQTTTGALINNQQGGGLRLFGYHEIRMKAPAVPGFLLRWKIEDYPASPNWTAEIDLDLWTDSSGVKHAQFSLPAGLPVNATLLPIYSTTALDITQFHIYGLNWQADHITAYIDGVQVGQIVNPGGDFLTQPMYSYILTSDAAYGIGDGSPTAASLPAFGQVDYYRLYSNLPSASGAVLVHAFNAGGTANSLTDSVGQIWNKHPDARLSSPPLLTALTQNALPMPIGSTITVSFTNPNASTQGTVSAWWIPYVSSFGSLVNVGSIGTTPPAPSITASTTAVFVTLPTTGLNTGIIQAQYRVHGTTAWTASPSPPHYITPNSGTLTDGLGNTWTIASGALGSMGVFVNGQYINPTANVTQMLLLNGFVYQTNAAGEWYGYQPTGSGLTPANVSFSDFGPTSPLLVNGVPLTGLVAGSTYDVSAYVSNTAGSGALSNIVQVTPSTATNFSISNGQIIDPHGNVFVARGFAIDDYTYVSWPWSSIVSVLGGKQPTIIFLTNFQSGGYSGAVSLASITPWINQVTANNCVVVISDYPGQQDVRSGADATACAAWYAAAAQAFRTNPYVWFCSQNEPVPATGTNVIATMHQAYYNAVRNAPASNNNIFLMEPYAGDAYRIYDDDPTIYPSMFNIVWNCHVYPTSYFNNPSAYGSQLLAYGRNLAAFSTSRDGLMPFIYGENGNSFGQTVISGGDQLMQAIFPVCTGASGMGSGWSMWQFQNRYAIDTGADQIVTGTSETGPPQSLTYYGQYIANAM